MGHLLILPIMSTSVQSFLSELNYFNYTVTWRVWDRKATFCAAELPVWIDYVIL